MKTSTLQFDLKVAVLYLLFGGAWIFLSDNVLIYSSSDPAFLDSIQIYKDLAFVVASALLLYFLLRSGLARRKAAEKELSETRELFQKLFNLDPIASVLFRLSDRVIVDLNAAGEQLFGYSKQEMVGQTSTKFDIWLDTTERDEAYKTVLANGSLRNYEFGFKKKSGEIGRALLYIDVLDLHREKYFLAAMIDITERDRTQEDLRTSQQRLQLALAATHTGVWEWNARNDEVFWSPECYEIVGMLPNTEKSLNGFLKQIHPDDIGKLNASIQQSIATRTRFDEVFRVVRANGETRWMQNFGRAEYDSNGKPLGMIGTVQDVTDRKIVEDKLQESDRRFREMLGNIDLIAVTLDNEGKINFCNDYFLGLVGWTREAAIGANWFRHFLPEGSDDVETTFSEGIASGIIPLHLENPIVTKDGETRYVHWNNTLLRNERGDVVGLASIGEDVTEQRKAELTLYIRERQMRAIITSLDDVVFEFNEDCVYLNVWTANEGLLFRPRSELTGKRIADVLGEDLGRPFTEAIKRVLESGKTEIIEYSLDVQSGLRWFMSRISPIMIDGNSSGTVSMLVRDITRRKVAEEALRNSHEQLRALSSHLQQVREEERTNIAREIHDELGQQLTALKMDISWLDKKIPAGDPKSEKAKSILSCVDGAIRSVRRIATELRPGILDDLGLVAALEWQARDFQNRMGVKCNFISDIDEVDPGFQGKTAIFRIFQESLTNVARHSGATLVTVHLSKNANELMIQIVDNGKGMGNSAEARNATLGVLGMKERAGLLGGSVEITEVAEGGTKVIARIPIR